MDEICLPSCIAFRRGCLATASGRLAGHGAAQGNRLRASTLAACGPDAGDIPLPGQFGEVLGASSSSMNGGPALPSLAAVCYIGN